MHASLDAQTRMPSASVVQRNARKGMRLLSVDLGYQRISDSKFEKVSLPCGPLAILRSFVCLSIPFIN